MFDFIYIYFLGWYDWLFPTLKEEEEEIELFYATSRPFRKFPVPRIKPPLHKRPPKRTKSHLNIRENYLPPVPRL